MTSDLINTETNDQRSIGGSIGVGVGDKGSINNIGIQAGHTGQDFESNTLATVGEGVIVTSDAITGRDSLAGVNRDGLNTEIIIKDQQTAGLDVDANIDARDRTSCDYSSCFSPRTRDGCDKDKWAISDIENVSIHAPVMGATLLQPLKQRRLVFQSTHP